MFEGLKPCPRCGSRKRLAVEQVTKTAWRQRGNRCQFTAGICDSKDEAQAVWNALPRRLRWTKEKPTEPGWYWFRYPNGRKFVWHVSGDVVTSHKGVIMALDKVQVLGGEWAGPIPAPEEATT